MKGRAIAILTGLALVAPSGALADEAPLFAMDPADPSAVTRGRVITGDDPYLSARSVSPSSTPRAAAGDIYTAALLTQNQADSFILNEGDKSFTFGVNPEFAGASTINDASFSKIDMEILRPDLGPEFRQIQVNMFTNDSSPMLPHGIDPDGPGGNGVLTALRLDVGSFRAFEDDLSERDPIEWDGLTFEVISAEFVVFVDGVALFVGPTAADLFETGLASAGVVLGIGGSPIDELGIVWVVREIPTPSALVTLAIGAGFFARRRR